MSRRNIGQLAANLFMLFMVYQLMRFCALVVSHLPVLLEGRESAIKVLWNLAYDIGVYLIGIWLIWANPSRSSLWFAPARLSGSAIYMCAVLRFLLLTGLVYYIQAMYSFYELAKSFTYSYLLLPISWMVLSVVLIWIAPAICAFVKNQMDTSVMWYTTALLAIKRGAKSYYNPD